MRQIRIRSLAKINLDLRVFNKRTDGFHELRTVFQTISLADSIEMEFARGRSRIDLDSAVDIPNNLIVKAAELIFEATQTSGLLKVRLKKRIPMGGGLGGGSSNAAATLLALPALIGKRLPLDRLMELAAQLGSDVPFFLLGGTAVGLGRGTELYPLPDLAAWPLTVVTPGIHVSTAAAYQGLNRELTITSPSSNMNSFQAFVWRLGSHLPGQDWGSVNDFEDVVFSQYPQLQSVKGKLLKLGARTALMSGSGSTLFGIFSNRELREKAVTSIRKEFGDENVHSVSMVSGKRYRALWWRQLADIAQPGSWPPQDLRVG